MVRVSTAHHVLSVVELIGPSRVLREFPDKLLPVAARFVLDGSPEARCDHTSRNLLGLILMFLFLLKWRIGHQPDSSTVCGPVLLLVVNSNFGRISYCFPDIDSYR